MKDNQRLDQTEQSKEDPGRGRPRSGVEVGCRIDEACKRIGTRKKAADAAGISTDQLLRIIRGTSEPGLSTVTRLAQAAGVSIDWIATGEGNPTPRESTASDSQPEVQIDVDVLSEVITILEEELQKRNRRLHPDRKALLIAEVYRIMLADYDEDTPDTRTGGHRVWIKGMLKLAT